MEDIKKSSKNDNIKAIIIDNNGLGIDNISNIISKYDDIEVVGIINPVIQSQTSQTLRRVSIPKGKDIVILDPLDILYLSAKNGKVAIVTKTEKYLSNYSLNYWEQKLKDLFFFRCHNSYLVNMERINAITPFFDNTCFIKFEGLEEKISVSRSYIKSFRQILGINI